MIIAKFVAVLLADYLLGAILILFQHCDNIVRWQAGTKRRLGEKAEGVE